MGTLALGWAAGVRGCPCCPPPPLFPPQELFIASSQQFAQETELSQRVRRWEERMEPLLQEQAGPGEHEGGKAGGVTARSPR